MPTLSLANLNVVEQQAVLDFINKHATHEWEAVCLELQQLAET